MGQTASRGRKGNPKIREDGRAHQTRVSFRLNTVEFFIRTQLIQQCPFVARFKQQLGRICAGACDPAEETCEPGRG